MATILKKIRVTEKTSNLASAGKYVFDVDAKATKNEIKKAVKAEYKVDAVKVSTINLRPVRKTYRGKPSFKQAGKKAIVTLKDGQKIDLA